jgi:hypothetical protein
LKYRSRVKSGFIYSVLVLLLLLHCFIFIFVLLVCCVSRSSLYCNIHSDLCTLCLSCYYFYIVLSLYLYCCYVMYPDHHFIVISLQTLRGSHGPDHMVVAFTTTYANQCLSLLILLIRISIKERCTTLCDEVCLWFATSCWLSWGPPVSSPSKTDRHEITEILLKVVLNTIKQRNKPSDPCSKINAKSSMSKYSNI